MTRFRSSAAVLLLLAILAFRARAAQPPVATEDEVRARCGTTCHKLPPPDILPKAAWRDELVRMMLIQEGMPEAQSGSNMLALPPDWLRLLRYYESAAPERLPAPDRWPPVTPSTPAASSSSDPKAASTVAFEKHGIARLLDPKPAAIANVRFLDLDGNGALDIVASDMRNGQVIVADAKVDFGVKAIASMQNPGHIEPVDLDKDGRQDLLVADLGSYLPADHARGAVVLLRRQQDGTFTPAPLATGLPRLSDARAADFDGDGDLDVIAAAFGWRSTGSVILLENQTKDWRAPRFETRVIDPRTGAIHVPIADLNKDGKPDFVVLLAQEHESVVAFLNTGKRDAPFKAETIYAAPHPNWGSSGIELVDLDKDGDLDVLLAHGDIFDDLLLKPYHGLQWLENRGTYPFTAHTLAALPGAQAVKAIDLDGDGDLDVVACALAAGAGEGEATLASLVWLEQVRPGVFERRTLEMGVPFHATVDGADYDRDGDIDLVVGWFTMAKPVSGWIDLWENTKVRASRQGASRQPASLPAGSLGGASLPAVWPAPPR